MSSASNVDTITTQLSAVAIHTPTDTQVTTTQPPQLEIHTNDPGTQVFRTVYACATCNGKLKRDASGEVQGACKNCKKVYYCSDECRIKAQPRHRVFCLEQHMKKVVSAPRGENEHPINPISAFLNAHTKIGELDVAVELLMNSFDPRDYVIVINRFKRQGLVQAINRIAATDMKSTSLVPMIKEDQLYSLLEIRPASVVVNECAMPSEWKKGMMEDIKEKCKSQAKYETNKKTHKREKTPGGRIHTFAIFYIDPHGFPFFAITQLKRKDDTSKEEDAVLDQLTIEKTKIIDYGDNAITLCQVCGYIFLIQRKASVQLPQEEGDKEEFTAKVSEV